MEDVDLLEGLDDAQLAAVTSPTDPVCVLAPAGSGKTRVITRRIAWRARQADLDVRRALAITFTTRAARELDERLRALLGRDTATSGTFHAIAWRMIRDHHAERRSTPPVLLERPATLLAEVIPQRHRASTSAITTAITWATARGIGPDDYAIAAGAGDHRAPIDPAITAEVFASYAAAKRRRGVVDFDDLIGECVRLFESDAAFARAQHWRFRHFFVDEYQDVNPLQQRLLEAWIAGREDLFVVGDPNQAIYGFNGADAGYLTGFAERHPNATIIELSTNHRSTPEIVAIADAALGRRGPDRRRFAVTTCTVHAAEDAADEALSIARTLRSEHTPGHPWRSQAVLVRTHAQTRPILELLERSGIPVVAPDDPSTRDAVRVATFHSAKGLEWPVVHLAGLEEGYVPDFHARSTETLAEERRLLYVATSRATRRLHLTWARRRRLGTRDVDRSPSRWLAPIVQALGPSSEPRPRRVSAVSILPPLEEPEPESSRDRLLRWRRATARAASVPLAVVLPDTVLDDLVRLAPSDPDELGKVPGLGIIKANRYGTALLDALHPGRSK
ncbi:MAG TPA: UvrD-helicase domain-containing protein [Acidimicrobiales bacterium]|nr:UvrD-helicase domain-containing protein [Acidimicrobiales bacterium]